MKISSEYIFLIVGLGAGALLAFSALVSMGGMTGSFLLSDSGEVSQDFVADRAERALELANDQDLKVTEVIDKGNIWKLMVEDQAGNVNRFYMTGDGEYIFRGVIDVDQFINNTERLKSFVSCLDDKGVRLYGGNGNHTERQIQILGGPRIVQDIFYNADNQTRRYLYEKGVRGLPVFQINDTLYEGLREKSWLGDVTGCEW